MDEKPPVAQPSPQPSEGLSNPAYVNFTNSPVNGYHTERAAEAVQRPVGKEPSAETLRAMWEAYDSTPEKAHDAMRLLYAIAVGAAGRA